MTDETPKPRAPRKRTPAKPKVTPAQATAAKRALAKANVTPVASTVGGPIIADPPAPAPAPVPAPDPVPVPAPAPVTPPLHAVRGGALIVELRALISEINVARWPSWLTLIASLVLGVLAVFNQTTLFDVGFNFPVALQTGVTWALAGAAWIGLGPIVGPRFAAALKIPPKIMGAISLLMLAGLTVAQQQLPATWAAVVICGVQVLGGLGFEPASIPTV